jgi:hypothetical protein
MPSWTDTIKEAVKRNNVWREWFKDRTQEKKRNGKY